MRYWNTLKPWQRKKLLFWFFFIVIAAVLFIGITSFSLYRDKKAEDDYWNYYLNEYTQYTAEETEKMHDAVQVSAGSYIENISQVNVKDSYYEAVVQIWFRWQDSRLATMEDQFEIYKGDIQKVSLVTDESAGGMHYQLFRLSVRVQKTFWTKRFPLGSYQLRLYLKPRSGIDQIVLNPDLENSYADPELAASGFTLSRHAVSLTIHRDEDHINIAHDEAGNPEVYSELLSAVELNRDSWGVYFKCIIALLGTSIWVFMTLFVCAYHRVDSMGMIPAILFGTVSNIMIGSNLVSDAIETGLLEYINIWGIYTIIIVTVAIININKIRNTHHDDKFAKFFGHVMFYTLLVTTAAGHIILPLSAYKF